MDAIQDNLGSQGSSSLFLEQGEHLGTPGDTSQTVLGVQEQCPGFHGDIGMRNREGELGMLWAPSPCRVSLPAPP